LSNDFRGYELSGSLFDGGNPMQEDGLVPCVEGELRAATSGMRHPPRTVRNRWLAPFLGGIAIGLCASLVAAPAGSSVILNTPGAFIELLTLVPGEGTGQHSIVTGEIGIVVEGDVLLSSPNGREALQAGKAFWLPGLTPHDIRNEGDHPARLYVIAMKRCD
jgi:quercetin dioxygenase-like cupin family protein